MVHESKNSPVAYGAGATLLLQDVLAGNLKRKKMK